MRSLCGFGVPVPDSSSSPIRGAPCAVSDKQARISICPRRRAVARLAKEFNASRVTRARVSKEALKEGAVDSVCYLRYARASMSTPDIDESGGAELLAHLQNILEGAFAKLSCLEARNGSVEALFTRVAPPAGASPPSTPAPL